MISDNYIRKVKKIHFAGIGGVSMGGLALFCLDKGMLVSGSDICENDMIKKLHSYGIKISIPHSVDAINNQELVVFTGAIKHDNIELEKARKCGIPCVERSQFLGFVSRCCNCSIAVAGTHGKTTTTAMLSKCFIDANKNPTIHLGGVCDCLNKETQRSEKIFITEACEYRESFLELKRDYAILLNIENDHLDYYKNCKKLKTAFLKFTSKTKTLITSFELNAKYKFRCKEVVTISLANKKANYYVDNITLQDGGGHSFDVYKDGVFFHKFKISVVGVFNVYNALCVVALCDKFKLDVRSVEKSLHEFSGVKRRFEHLPNYNKAQVIHDYAHHPTEIKSVVTAFREVFSGKLILVFQPHTYSRTKDLLQEFIDVLSIKTIDTLVLLPTYSARECESDGVSALELSEKLSKHRKCYYMTFEKAKKFLAKHSQQENTAFLILGAGDIENFARNLMFDD